MCGYGSISEPRCIYEKQQNPICNRLALLSLSHVIVSQKDAFNQLRTSCSGINATTEPNRFGQRRSDSSVPTSFVSCTLQQMYVNNARFQLFAFNSVHLKAAFVYLQISNLNNLFSLQLLVDVSMISICNPPAFESECNLVINVIFLTPTSIAI